MESLAVQVRDKEELFILKGLKALCENNSECGPLYLVGGWPRAKLTNTECFEYELKCFLRDFITYKKGITALLESKQCAEVFPECKPSRTKFKRANSQSNCVLMFRLSNVEDKQYKISLKNFESDDLLVDARGRDFTFNTLYCDVNSKVFFDPFGGIADLIAGFVKTVGPPQVIFASDSNLLFRLFEFSIKYDLNIHEDVIKYLKSRKDFGKILSHSISSQLKTLCSAVRKFFCKNYVSKMIHLIVSFDFFEFFRLNFENKELFRQAFLCLPDLFELVASSLNDRFGHLLLNQLSVQNSKAFLMKARLFTVSFFFYPLQPSYALQFLRMFLLDNKKLPCEYSFLIASLHQILNRHLSFSESLDNYSFSDSEESEVRQAISKYECEKSCWLFLIVYSGYKLYVLRSLRKTNLLPVP